MTPPAPSPILEYHHRVDAELQAYDTIDIVSTFGEPQAEYAAVRKAAALFDLPQRGVVELTGKDRHAFLNNLISNEVFGKDSKTPMPAGTWVYAFLLNLKGRVVCDMNVIEVGDRMLLEVDARLAPVLTAYLDRYLFAEAVKVRDATGELYEIALHGPTAADILIAEGVTEATHPGQCRAVSVIGVPTFVWRDDVCGVPGYQLIVPRDRVLAVWEHLLARHGGEISLGKRALRPIGWAAFNATRIEAGRPLFGIDFELAPPSMPGKKAEADAAANDAAAARPVGVLPAETSLLARAVSFTKGCYLGQEIVARMNARGQVARQWVGLRIKGDALPLAGAQLLDEQQAVVGMITSSTMSPMLSDTAITLAVLRRPHFEPGRVVLVQAEGAVREAVVVPLPFLPQDSA